MSESPNKLIKFWQELKRRKVFKVIAMYAGTAFIILQLFDIIAQPLQWPTWTLTFVIVLLCIGFIITLLISWIYDITPEGIKKTESIEAVIKKKSQQVQIKRRLRASDIIIAAMAIVIVILLYPKIFKKNTLEKLRSSGERISVAVMPFQNMTNDTIWNVWQDGIQNELISSLTNSEELKVRQTESINNLIQSKGLTNYASITPSIASKLSLKLDANVFIFGTIKQSGSTIRLNAQLTDSKTRDVIKSFQIDGTSENIFRMIDSLSLILKDFLVISKMEQTMTTAYQHVIFTNYPEALRYFIYGHKAFYKRDFPTAVKLLSQAIAIDSNLTYATLHISWAYYNMGIYEEAKKWCLKAYEKRALMSLYQKTYTNFVYAALFETPFEAIKYLKQLQEVDDKSPHLHYDLGQGYFYLQQFDKATTEFEKAIEMFDKWGSKPLWVWEFTKLGWTYHITGKYKKEKKLYKKAEQDFPDDSDLVYRQAVLLLTEKDKITANRYIEKLRTILKENSSSEIDIITKLAGIYCEAGIPDKAEEYLRQALSLETNKPDRMNSLGYFLVDKDRNINEGLELVDKALASRPADYNYLNTKGWGLFKQKNYQEALDILQKSWDLRMKNAVYDHEAFLHLESAKKAVANLKNN